MITEIPEVRQNPGEERRRWFSGDGFDLIVWYQGRTITGFQLCYDQQHPPRAITWSRDRGIRHHIVDDGEPAASGMKQTPILIPDKQPDVKLLLQQFGLVATRLPVAIRRMVLSKLTEAQS